MKIAKPLADTPARVEKSDAEWRAQLTEMQYRVARQAATERAAIIAKAKAQNRTPPPDYHDPPPF